MAEDIHIYTIIGLKDNEGETIFTPSAQAELVNDLYSSICFAKMMQDPSQLCPV